MSMESNERIIPIEIEGSDSKPDELNISSETDIGPAKESVKSSASTDVDISDINISSSVEKIVLSDNVACCSKAEQDTEVKIPEPTLPQCNVPDNVECCSKAEQDIEIKIPERMLPPYNVPERIIIILDRAEDEVFTCFELGNGTKLKPLNMLKDALKFFVHNKSSFASKHKFALMTLNENSCTWVSDFTNNAQKIISDVNDVVECQAEDIFDMTAVFDMINKKITVPVPNDDLIIPPPFIVRAVFLYSRSITMPQITFTEQINNLLESPYFTFDVAMTHEIPDSSNKCNLIFTKLQQLDTKGFAYFFPISRSASQLYVAMAKLLAHPLQRCTQKDANYKLD